RVTLMSGFACSGSPTDASSPNAPRRSVAAMRSTTPTGRRPLAMPSSWLGTPSVSRRTRAGVVRPGAHPPRATQRVAEWHGGRRPPRQQPLARAGASEVDRDLGTRVAGADDEHGLSAVGV